MNFLKNFAYTAKNVVISTVKVVGASLDMFADFALRCVPLFCLVAVFTAASFAMDLALPAIVAAGGGFLVQAGAIFVILWIACETVVAFIPTGKISPCEI